MQLGNWRQVILQGPFAIKLPRPERLEAALRLNRWEAEMWNVWRHKFGWPHLCPVIWSEPAGHILVMQRATQDVSEAEIRAFEDAWLDSDSRPLPSAESKPADWGHLDNGRLVLLDYGYACDTEDEVRRMRAYYESRPAT
jgi:hypothetical protein